MYRIFLTTLLLASLVTSSAADTIDFGRFEMNCSWPSAEVKKLGVEAVNTHWPADKSFEDCTAQVIVVDFDADMMKMMSDDGSDPLVYALSTYLAMYGEPQATAKTQFLGTNCERRDYQSGVPRDHMLHVYSSSLKDGSFVVVGVRVFRATEETEKLLESVGVDFRFKATSR